ncbi:hypothetical protein [Streptomyces sp. H27-C3]|uniref:hypothetical protein n=1 Tax=Streptomyces sp. H27-C3 TaxID=3046305 RepID=UPI0024B8A479|nr:hypothetical protein [Streptomyces sp. H27-C3]MDJ0463992.1 hypothetical protein [Streptomyces sp. H27-C3]
MSNKTQTLQTQYAQQVAADLKRNVGEQERIAAEVAALQGQLEVLKLDCELLEGMQSALGGAAAPAVKPTKTAAVPKARRAQGSVTADAAKSPKNTKKSVKANTATSARSASPSLREVVVALLGQHNEPRSAAEVSAELAQAQPERAVNVTLVRNALEASVAKNQSTRTKQGKFVYYTALQDGSATAQASVATSDANA